VLRENSVGQQVTDLGLRPSVHNAVDDAVQVGARFDVVRDARTATPAVAVIISEAICRGGEGLQLHYGPIPAGQRAF